MTEKDFNEITDQMYLKKIAQILFDDRIKLDARLTSSTKVCSKHIRDIEQREKVKFKANKLESMVENKDVRLREMLNDAINNASNERSKNMAARNSIMRNEIMLIRVTNAVLSFSLL